MGAKGPGGGILADFDAQPNRIVSPLPELSANQREEDEAELMRGYAEWPESWPAPVG